MDIQWPLLLFTVIAGIGSWTFAFVSVNEFKSTLEDKWALQVSAIVAITLLIIGGCCSVFHLSHVEHILWVLQHPAPGIFVEAVCIGINIVLALIYILMVRRDVEGTPRKILCGISIVFAFVFTYACGSSYMMSSQTTWNNIGLPLCYMGTCVPGGVGIWMILNCYFKAEKEAFTLIGKEMIFAGLMSGIFGTVFAITCTAILNPDLGAPVYWVGILLIGSIIPLVVGYMLLKDKIPVALADKKFSTAMQIAVCVTVCGFVGASCGRVIMYTSSIMVMQLFGVSI